MILEKEDILKHLPHRPPFLFVDRVLEYEPNRRIVGSKQVSIEEPFFEGHFPGYPIMPGVLIIEALAQVGGVLAFLSNPGAEGGQTCIFMSMDKVKFRRPVFPGDELVLEMCLIHRRDPNWRFRGRAFVKGKIVAEAELLSRVGPLPEGGPAQDKAAPSREGEH